MKPWMHAAAEELRQIGVQLVVGLLLAYALVYLRTADAIHAAELENALTAVGLDDTASWPTGWAILGGAIALGIAGVVYATFGPRRRATFLVAALALVAILLHVDGRGHSVLAHVSVFAALAIAIPLTVWHERWLATIYEDE